MKIDAVAIADHIRDLVLAEEARMELERLALKKRGSKDIPAHIGGIGGTNITGVGEFKSWTGETVSFFLKTEAGEFVITVSPAQRVYRQVMVMDKLPKLMAWKSGELTVWPRAVPDSDLWPC